MTNAIAAGIDAGSTLIKIALYDGSRLECWQRPAGWNPQEEATALLSAATAAWSIRVADLASIVGTGYGRNSLPCVTKAVTEISCHARGAIFLSPGARTVIDIGGQDAKTIVLDSQGKVSDFVMNDKCAAGTGRFLQVMAHALELSLAEIARLSFAGEAACKINSMCTVFAESEVIGLLNRGHSRHAIMAGLYRSIASRVAAMAARLSPAPPLLLTGGLSQHACLVDALQAELKVPVTVPGRAVYAGAIGAALNAWESIRN